MKCQRSKFAVEIMQSRLTARFIRDYLRRQKSRYRWSPYNVLHYH